MLGWTSVRSASAPVAETCSEGVLHSAPVRTSGPTSSAEGTFGRRRLAMADDGGWPASAPADAPVPPRAYRDLCARFRAGLQAGLGDSLTSLYLYGAVTFPRPVEW